MLQPNDIIELTISWKPEKQKLRPAGKKLRVLGVRPEDGLALVTTHLASKPVWGSVFLVPLSIVKEQGSTV